MAIETDAGNMLPQDSDEIPHAPQPTPPDAGELGIGGQFAVKVMFFESVVHDRHVLGSYGAEKQTELLATTEYELQKRRMPIVLFTLLAQEMWLFILVNTKGGSK